MNKVFNKITVPTTFFTIFLVLFYLLVRYFIKLPFIDLSIFKNGFSLSTDIKFSFSIFTLGLTPFIAAVFIVELFSKVKSFVNKKLEDKTVKISIVIITLLFSIVQSLGVAYSFESIKYYGETIEYLVNPNLNIYLFRAVIISSMVAGTFLLLWTIDKLNKHLIVNGYILIFIIQIIISYNFSIKEVKKDISDKLKKVSSSLSIAKSESISYEIDKTKFNNDITIEMFKKSIKGYLDKKGIKFKIKNDKIELSGSRENLVKVKNDFSKKHSLYFLEENPESISITKTFKDVKLSNGIDLIESSYMIMRTGESIADIYFKSNDLAILKDFIKRVEIPKGYKLFYAKVEYSKIYYRTYLFKENYTFSGFLLEKVESLIDTRSNSPYVALTFNKLGARLLAELTGRLKGYRLGIVIDGVVNSAPIVQDAILGGRASITMGSGSYNERVQKAVELKEILKLSSFVNLLK